MTGQKQNHTKVTTAMIARTANFKDFVINGHLKTSLIKTSNV